MTVAPVAVGPFLFAERVRRLYQGDALEVCAALEPALRFDLVYLDPPFNTGASFAARTRAGEGRGRKHAASGPAAYEDRWGGLDAFLAMLEPRVAAMRERMSDRATLWLHLDQRAVHDAKVLCDRVFGRAAFRGEVVWVPGNGARKKHGPPMTHQTILVYSRSVAAGGGFTWNGGDPALREPYAATSLSMHFTNRDADGRLYRERVVNGKAYRYYADEGRRLGSVWTDCPSMSANSPLRDEATGWPTQKPEKLLERIVRLASREGDLVADLMCGSGAMLRVAERTGRAWIGGDLDTSVARETVAR